jgi:peptidoglycan/xylan/chitin deacetylase (PgdA/CDA1 family)
MMRSSGPALPAPPAWRPPAVVVLSVVLHVSAVVAFAIHPGQWPWILALLAGNHLVLASLVLVPRGSLLGPNIVRLPAAAAARREVSLTFDDGPDPALTPQVLDLLERHAARASFFCIGEKAAEFPHLVEEITRRGHSVENHSLRHSRAFAFYGPLRLNREIRTAQMVIAQVSGRRPEFFRAPAGIRSVLLDPVLARCGLRYVSWTRRGLDGIDNDPDRVLSRLADGLGAGDILVLHDGAGASAGEAALLTVLPRLLKELAARQLVSVPLPEAFRDG